MLKNYKLYGQEITKIIHKDTKLTEHLKQIKLITSNTKFKRSNLIVKNNPRSPKLY